MPLSVCGEPWVCVYWVADVIGDTPLLRWKVKYYKALCVLTILVQEMFVYTIAIVFR